MNSSAQTWNAWLHGGGGGAKSAASSGFPASGLEAASLPQPPPTRIDEAAAPRGRSAAATVRRNTSFTYHQSVGVGVSSLEGGGPSRGRTTRKRAPGGGPAITEAG